MGNDQRTLEEENKKLQEEIRQLKQEKKTMEEEKRLMEELLQVIPDMVSVHDADLRILYSNWNGFAGVAAEKRSTGTKCHLTYRGYDTQCPDCRAAQVVETGEPYRETAELENGGWVELRVMPLLDELGQVTQFVEWVRDITQVIATEKELEKTSQFLTTLLAQSPNPMAIFDEDGRIVLMGEVNAQLMGCTAKEAVGKTFRELLGEELGKSFHQTVLRVHQSKQPLLKKDVIKGKDGSRVYQSSIFPIPLRNSEKAHYASFALDITEYEKTKENLVVAKEAAEAANSVKTQFLANMSHELRTPLNGLMGMLQLMQTTNLNEEQLEFMGNALNSSLSLTRVVEDILNYTSLEKRTQKVLEEPFQLTEFLQEIMGLHQTAAAHKGLSLSVHRENSLPNDLMGDRFRLRQILGNLVGNAVKFTENGAVHLSARRETRKTLPNRLQICFQVKDTGIGIPPEKLDYVFQQFSQADETHTRPYGGLGLGLAVAREQAAMLGGILTADSTPGQGSVFTLTCEVGLGQQAQPAVKREEMQDTCLTDQGLHHIQVLVVDDDYTSRVMAKLHLEKMGCHVKVAEDGEEALAIVSRETFHLIFMDCQMPGMNGYEATRCIREGEKGKGRHTPIVAMTAKVLPGDREECLEAGMDGFLAKPFKRKQMELAVMKYVKV